MAPDRPAESELDEKALIAAAQLDPAQFAELYERNFDRVYAYIARRVRDRSQAQDLTAEVFHHALANLKRFEWRGAPLAAWLYRIAANAIADDARRLERERGIALDHNPAQDNPEEIEHRAGLFRMVRELPADQRRVLHMRFAEQKSIREIAGELDRSEGAVKQLQFRGLEALRARVGEKHG